MHDKLGALEKLGKHLGLFQGKAATVTVNTGTQPLHPSNDEHWLDHLNKVHQAMAERAKKAN